MIRENSRYFSNCYPRTSGLSAMIMRLRKLGACWLRMMKRSFSLKTRGRFQMKMLFMHAWGTSRRKQLFKCVLLSLWWRMFASSSLHFTSARMRSYPQKFILLITSYGELPTVNLISSERYQLVNQSEFLQLYSIHLSLFLPWSSFSVTEESNPEMNTLSVLYSAGRSCIISICLLVS